MWVIGVYNVLHTGMFIYGSFPRPLDYDCDYISGAVWQFSEFGSGNFQGGSAQCNALWTGMYSLINKANQAIAQIEDMSGPTEAHKKNCLGECYFLKAWAYFYLARAYGDIPVYSVSVNESGSYTDNPRIPVRQVYELALHHCQNEIKGRVRVRHNQEQSCFFIPDGVKFQFVVLHQLPHLPDVKGR